MLAALILNYNDSETTISLVKKLKEYTILDKIVIVDNKSTDESFRNLQALVDFKVDVILTERNGGYGYGNNFGINYLSDNYNCQYVLICNPDIYVEEQVIERCLRFQEKNEKCAVVAPMMRNINNNLEYGCAWKVPSFKQYLFFSLPVLNVLGKGMYYDESFFKKRDSPIEVGCVAGSLLMVNLDLMKKFGMYDEDIFLYCEETVIGLKFSKSGYKTYLFQDEQFLHMHSVSIDKSIKKKTEQKKLMWKSRLTVMDKYFEINFVQKLLAVVISKISIFETYCFSFLKGLL